MPNFSIVVPVYNVDAWLDAALASVETQSFGDFEVIIVDDGSTDGSGRIAQSFCARDARFRYLRQDNRGQSVARNVGTALASGTYLYYMDGDDVIDADTLRLCHAEFVEHGVDVVLFGATALIEDGPPPAGSKVNSPRPDVASPLPSDVFVIESVRQDRYIVSPCCLIARRSAIGNLRFIDGIVFEDNHFVAALLVEKKIMVSVLNRPLFRRRYRPNSTMTSRRTMRHYESLYQLLPQMCALSFAALDAPQRTIVRSRLIGNLLGDLHNTSAQIGAGVGMRTRNLLAAWRVASSVSMRVLTFKRILLALVPELYRARG
ncbi:glycosyltransferase family 2 protein [Paraburkholderia bannensis]|uniref:glycosyltransferase family 2 protein n=1 Tax=Paraburkholderia bannensis TaxID=765414 RepID=UPI002AC3551F|nr:glycosyltransferase family A protein [Paraburkholderia bannensis]